MTALQLAAALIGAAGGFGGLGLALRARSQNAVDQATARKIAEETEGIDVATMGEVVDAARAMVKDVRQEMDTKVTDLRLEVARLRGQLEVVMDQRDKLLAESQLLRNENRRLRGRIAQLEREVTNLKAARHRVTRKRPSSH